MDRYSSNSKLWWNVFNTNQQGMLSSKRIANRTEKEHGHVLRDIRNMLSELHIDNPNMDSSEYQVIMNNSGLTSEILLNERLSLCLASGYSIKLRMAIIDDWAEMKKEIFIVPKNFKEALLLAVAQQEKIEEQQALIELQKPKVEFADQLLSTTNALDFSATAKAMNLPFGRTTLFAHCRDLAILRMNNESYQQYIDSNYFILLETSFTHPKTGDRILTTKTMITAKGQLWLAKKLKENNLI